MRPAPGSTTRAGRASAVRWFAVLIASAAAMAIGYLVAYLAPGIGGSGKGGPPPNPFLEDLPSFLVLLGVVGIVVGIAGIARSRPTWRRLSALSATCGALALLLAAPSPWIPWALSAGSPYLGIWLGGLLGLVAIGTGGATFIRHMRNKALDIPLAVFGVLAGIPCVLWALWVLGLTVGGGLGD
jgi:hypothetical protein